jgi:hypothetical protein
MRLMERKNVATVKVMRRMAGAAAVPLRGVRRFWGKDHAGMVVGFKEKVGAGDPGEAGAVGSTGQDIALGGLELPHAV